MLCSIGSSHSLLSTQFPELISHLEIGGASKYSILTVLAAPR